MSNTITKLPQTTQTPETPRSPLISSTRRQQLGEFLRAHRTRLQPEDVGLVTRARRRTPGLRREEIADLAEVGVSWYTWLEQGREINPSPQVLERIARTLRLSEDESTYLFQLAGHSAPQRDQPDADAVSPSLQRLLDGMASIPAYIVNRRWDRVAWNRPALALLGNFAAIPPPQRNILRRVFTNPETRRYMGNWESMAYNVLSEFRATSARFPEDPSIHAMIDELLEASPEFRAWWPKRDVIAQRTKRATIIHASAGPIEFEVSNFPVPDKPGLTLHVYTVLPDNGSPDKLQRIIADFNASG